MAYWLVDWMHRDQGKWCYLLAQGRKSIRVPEGLCSVNHTRLHSQEAGPRIIGAAVAQTSQETEEQTNQISMAGVQLLPPSSRDC
jgi:hypothetical protein